MNAREEWLMARRTGLGGSDIGAILGLSPYRTPVDVWMDKTGRAEPQHETLQMRFGNYAEEFVAREYTNKTGNRVQRFTTMLHHETAPLLGNVDRLVIPDGQKIASHRSEIRTDLGLECKTASAFAAYNSNEWGEEGSDGVPMHYLVQPATYMALTGCSAWDLAVLFGNQEVRVYHLRRDMDLEQMIIAKANEWWNRHVIADIAPEPTCDADVKRLFPQSVAGESCEANDALLVSLSDLRNARSEIDHWEKRAELYQLEIKAHMGSAESLTLNGQTLITWKSAKPSQKTDWKAVAMASGAHPDCIAAHTTVTAGARRFLLKDEK